MNSIKIDAIKVNVSAGFQDFQASRRKRIGRLGILHDRLIIKSNTVTIK